MNGFFVRFALFFVAVFTILFALVWFYLSVTSSVAAAGLEPGRESVSFQTAHVTLTTRNGNTHDFQVELAITETQRQRGLMFRKNLAADRGMLFDFGTPRPISMWMKNTPVSLDMLFVGPTGRVAHITHDTVPYSHHLITAPQMVRYVLEVPAGTAKRLGFKIGDRMQVSGI